MKKKVIFHKDVQQILDVESPLILELGCGIKKTPGRIGIDILDLPGVDIVADLNTGLSYFPDESVDAIYSHSLLEHVEKLDILMYDIWRVLKPNGKKHLFVPHFSNPYYYSDYTHERFFGLYSFEYFSGQTQRFERTVPSFYHDFSFSTESIRLIFTSTWRTRRIHKRLAQNLFNHSPWWQEFYEENFCYLIPCYGIEATLVPQKPPK